MLGGFTKKQLKKTDIVTLELKQGFTWTIQHSKMILFTGLGLILIGVLYSSYEYYIQNKEKTLQEKFYKAEKVLLDKKAQFDLYKNSSEKVALDAQKKEKDKTNKGKDSANGNQPPKIEGEKSTGDFDKDLGPAVADLLVLVNAEPSTKAAKMAALTLGPIYADYKKTEEALKVLGQIRLGSDLLSHFIRVQKGVFLSDKNDCALAIKEWEEVLKDKTVSFLHTDLRLRIGACAEAMNDTAKAEQLYNQVISESRQLADGANFMEGKALQQGDSPSVKEAERFLRYLKLKSGAAGAATVTAPLPSEPSSSKGGVVQ